MSVGLLSVGLLKQHPQIRVEKIAFPSKPDIRTDGHIRTDRRKSGLTDGRTDISNYIERQTNRQKDRYANKLTDKQTDRRIEIEIEKR